MEAEKVTRALLQDLVIMGSPRIGRHRVIPLQRQQLSPHFIKHCQFISLDGKLQRRFAICTICDIVYTNTRANRQYIVEHLIKKHHKDETAPSSPTSRPVKVSHKKHLKLEMPKPMTMDNLETPPIKNEEATTKALEVEVKKPYKRRATVKHKIEKFDISLECEKGEEIKFNF